MNHLLIFWPRHRAIIQCMNRLFCASALLALPLSIFPQSTGPKRLTINVNGPTIVAFSPPVSQSDIDTDKDGINEALDDFQFYESAAHKPLVDAGIRFTDICARSFYVQDGKRQLTFRSRKVEIGYYFIAPGRTPHIEYGVMTDRQILDAARAYFHIGISHR